MYSVGIDDMTKNTSITDGKVIGEGIFDKLMETATLHLKAQFDEGRIRGEDFAQAYMAVYTANLSTALQLLLQQHIAKLQADNLAKDVELKEQSLLLGLKELDLKDKELELRDKELDLSIYQLEEILPVNKDNLLKDVEVKEAQITGITKDNSIKDYQLSDVLPKEVLKLQEEIDLLARQESELSLNGTADRAIKGSQKLLVDAQTITEGAKKDLVVRQKEGFDDTHLLDLLKYMTDSFSVLFSVAVDSDKLVLPDIISKGDAIDKLGREIADNLGVILPGYVPPTPPTP